MTTQADIIDRLSVWWGERIAGELTLDRGGAMHFCYAGDWLDDPQAVPLSQAMPKRPEPYDDRICKAVFGGLLPEEAQRTAIARALGVSADNPFRLLQALGGDVAGALAFLPVEDQPERSDSNPAAEALSDGALAALLERLPLTPMLAGEGGARLSLAGAQSKLPVVMVDGQVAIPRPGEPSTHLIKPEPDRFAGLAENEAFCLALAHAVGLDAASASWRQAGGHPFLLVERYDRVIEQGVAHRLHQEDFAQALGVPSNRKYAADGGPTFREVFAMLRQAATRPAIEVLKLADAAIFNLIIGNADAHAKNFSLLRKAGGEVVLAPLYDLVSTLAWPQLSPRLAMKFGKAATLEDVDGEAFTQFARDAGLAAPFIRRRAAALSRQVLVAIGRPELSAGLPAGERLDTLRTLLTDRAARLELKASGSP
ncbi:type II toxin-antitoxin system HipA family toxin [Novosphingobium aerophilum]|uniref:type II toxin-antitoxin system HipA family toxin n=1 Tax=Novosphingobium aerophilum TaxID=2839843 RepID=UPI002E2C0891|nr:type II toxin-antitoxin system HipA family toxin [Novosphingobium aerophilum]